MPNGISFHEIIRKDAVSASFFDKKKKKCRFGIFFHETILKNAVSASFLIKKNEKDAVSASFFIK